MKTPDEETSEAGGGFSLNARPRPNSPLILSIPLDTLASLEKIAASRDMSAEALVKLYIGQGLRQDLGKLFADRLMEKIEQVLTRHIHSEQEVTAILKEIRVETTA